VSQRQARYNQSLKGKARLEAYEKTEKAKLRRQKYQQSFKGRQTRILKDRRYGLKKKGFVGLRIHKLT
jgi:hypothetical protein